MSHPSRQLEERKALGREGDKIFMAPKETGVEGTMHGRGSEHSFKVRTNWETGIMRFSAKKTIYCWLCIGTSGKAFSGLQFLCK